MSKMQHYDAPYCSAAVEWGTQQLRHLDNPSIFSLCRWGRSPAWSSCWSASWSSSPPSCTASSSSNYPASNTKYPRSRDQEHTSNWLLAITWLEYWPLIGQYARYQIQDTLANTFRIMNSETLLISSIALYAINHFGIWISLLQHNTHLTAPIN